MPKTKADVTGLRNSKQSQKTKKAANLPEASVNKADDLSLATRRPRREAKVVHDPFKDEDNAQLELAIRLSIQAQKADKKKKVKNENVKLPVKLPATNQLETDNHVLERKGKSPAKPTSTTARNKPKNIDKPPKRHISATATKSPTKKVKVERLEVKDEDLKELKNKEIPSTSSFISYVLQKGSSNRDLHLAKKFEREETHEEPGTGTNATNTESESECDGS